MKASRRRRIVIVGIFRKFRELGSARQVLLWYRDEKLLIPAFSRESGHRKLVWIEPVYPRIFGILKNPTYAGFFVWGRNHTRTSIVDGTRTQDAWPRSARSSGRLPFRITTKGILRGKSLCVISNRSAPTPVGMHAWGVRMAQ